MQYKLFNFYKILSTFASTLVGAFIPLIIYKATNSIILAMVYIFCQALSRMLCNHIFQKFYVRSPQLFLLLTVFPLTIYNVFLILIDKYMVLSLIMIIIAHGMNLSFRNNSSQILFNYSSGEKKSGSKLVLTNALQNFSMVVATLSGGIFLDMNKTVLILISLSLYIISVLPLFVYFIKNRKNKTFNKDFVSNAVMAYEEDKTMNIKSKKLSLEIIISYFVIFTIYAIANYFTGLYNIHMFLSSATFAIAGYISSVVNISRFVGSALVPVLTRKLDNKIIVPIMTILVGGSIVAIPNISNAIIIAILLFIFGLSFEVLANIFMSSLMTKSRIVGVANKSILASEDGYMTGQMINALFVMIFGTITPVFYFMGTAMVVLAIMFPIREEKLRKKLVNFLQNNEIE